MNGATARGRIYARKFDHDEARARHAAGESVSALAEAYGVTYNAVDRVVKPGRLEIEARARARYTEKQVCDVCGGRAWKQAQRTDDGRNLCRSCRGKERRTRFTEVDGGVHALCFGCRKVKPLDEFPGGVRFRDVRPKGVSGECRACQTRKRRERRHANPEATLAYHRSYRRRRKQAA